MGPCTCLLENCCWVKQARYAYKSTDKEGDKLKTQADELKSMIRKCLDSLKEWFVQEGIIMYLLWLPDSLSIFLQDFRGDLTPFIDNT